MRVTIRPFASEDAEAVASVMFASVRQGARSDYSAEQVRAWAPEPPSRSRVLEWAGDGRLLLVAVTEQDALVGWVDMTADGCIDHLFCAPEVIGQGVGAALYDAVEGHARRCGLAQLSVHASELARRLFTARGFTTDQRRQVERRGVLLHHYVMRKALEAGRPT